jgi:superfamily I DNA/RNA helicase
VVSRAVRLIEHGQERFVKVIRSGPKARGRLVLAPDPGDQVARARRLMSAWYGREDGGYAVLARTNAELAPVAAAALEQGIPYQSAQDGLLLGEDRVAAVIQALRTAEGWKSSLADLDGFLRASDAISAPVRHSVIAWAAGLDRLADLPDAIVGAAHRNAELRTDDARLVLATMHTTKGLEFDHVAVIGLDDGRFPSERTLNEADDRTRALEEERRLAYVAWTRARCSLLLVFDPAAPSVFLREAFDEDELAA